MTSRNLGQIVRLAGLAIEAGGILVQSLRTQTDAAGAPLPGHFSSHLVWIVVGAGFLLWLAGTILIYWPRRGRDASIPEEPPRRRLL